MAYDNTNRGIISKNDRKEKDTHPDIKGEINVDGTDYWLSGWRKERNDGSGSFYSLSIKRKDAQRAIREQPAEKPVIGSAEFPDEVPF